MKTPQALLAILFAAALAFSGPVEDMAVNTWYEVPNSHLKTVDAEDNPAVNPNYPNAAPWHAVSGVGNVMAYSGGAFDTKGNRLLVWGGGHSGYAGNEMYAFNVDSLKWSLFTKPSYPFNNNANPTAGDGDYNPDGAPVTRHTYNSLQYLPETDGFYAFGGVGFYSTGQTGSTHTECLNLTTMQWERKVDITCGFGEFSAYDPAKGVCWIRRAWENGLISYNPTTNVATTHGSTDGAYIDYDETAVIDPIRGKMVVLGPGQGDAYNPGTTNIIEWDISNPDAASIRAVPVKTTGDTSVFGHGSPGFQYDPVSAKLVAWVGGADVYTLDLDTKIWTKHPPAVTNTVVPTPPQASGTYGRFRYVPSRNIFVLVNSAYENVFIYKFTDPPGTSIQASRTVQATAATIKANPNPFHSGIRISVPFTAQNLSAGVYNLNGRKVADLTTGLRKEGSVLWNADCLPGGLYFLRVKTGDGNLVSKLLLQR